MIMENHAQTGITSQSLAAGAGGQVNAFQIHRHKPMELMQSAHNLTRDFAQSDCKVESGFNMPVEVSE